MAIHRVPFSQTRPIVAIAGIAGSGLWYMDSDNVFEDSGTAPALLRDAALQPAMEMFEALACSVHLRQAQKSS